MFGIFPAGCSSPSRSFIVQFDIRQYLSKVLTETPRECRDARCFYIDYKVLQTGVFSFERFYANRASTQLNPLTHSEVSSFISQRNFCKQRYVLVFFKQNFVVHFKAFAYAPIRAPTTTEIIKGKAQNVRIPICQGEIPFFNPIVAQKNLCTENKPYSPDVEFNRLDFPTNRQAPNQLTP